MAAQLIEVQQLEVFGSLERSPQLVAAQLPGEVEEGSSHRGDRYPVDHPPVGADEVSGSVANRSTRCRMMPRDERGHRDRFRRPSPDPP
jgi:hypothetical protein